MLDSHPNAWMAGAFDMTTKTGLRSPRLSLDAPVCKDDAGPSKARARTRTSQSARDGFPRFLIRRKRSNMRSRIKSCGIPISSNRPRYEIFSRAAFLFRRTGLDTKSRIQSCGIPISSNRPRIRSIILNALRRTLKKMPNFVNRQRIRKCKNVHIIKLPTNSD
jgi:hypothetical protein